MSVSMHETIAAIRGLVHAAEQVIAEVDLNNVANHGTDTTALEYAVTEGKRVLVESGWGIEERMPRVYSTDEQLNGARVAYRINMRIMAARSTHMWTLYKTPAGALILSDDLHFQKAGYIALVTDVQRMTEQRFIETLTKVLDSIKG